VLQSDLVSDPRLQEYMLQYQKRVQMLCCSKCHILLCTKTAIAHIQVYHSALQIKISQSKFRDICSELNIHESYPSPKELYGIDALSGLNIYTMALVCQHDGCSMICATGAAMRKHYQKSHIKKGEHLPTKWAVVSAQKLDNNRHWEYFEVNPPSYELEKPINYNWIDNLESNLEEVYSRIALDSPDP